MRKSPIEVCTIKGCSEPFYCRTWCSAHYQTWQRHGDPLGGGPTRGFARQVFEAQARLSLEAWPLRKCVIWPYARSHLGYGYVWIGGKMRMVHREILLRATGGRPPLKRAEAAHTCGKGHLGCYSLRHLVWASHKDNCNMKPNRYSNRRTS